MNFKEKLKHICRKAVNGILAFTLCSGSGMLPAAVHAEAKTVNAYADNSETMNVYVNVNARDHTGTFYQNYYGIEGVITDTYTGKRMFCVEPGPLMSEGVHTSIGTLQSYFGKEKGDKIQLISYYGTLSGSKTDYFAAQSLIWEVAYSTEVQQRGSNGAAINASKQVIMSKVNSYLSSGREVRGTSEVYRSQGQDIMSMGTVVFDKQIDVSISKHSASASITSDNSSYSLAGAKYRVYEGKTTKGKLLGELVTDENGYAQNKGITVSYETTHVTFVEVQAPKGFQLDSEPIVVSIQNNSAHADISETPLLQKLSVELYKTSSDSVMTDGNENYSLKGAVYEISYVLNDKNFVLGQLVTDEKGYASGEYEGIPLGVNTLCAKELSSPSGYVLDSNMISVKTDNGKSVFHLQDKPVSALLEMEIEKQSMDAVDNPAPLSGAEFTVSFYDTSYDTVDVSSLKPERTWVIVTKKDETTGKYITKLNQDYLVSGDAFYLNEEGMPVLPLGVLSIQETRAPEGYTLEHTLTCLVNGKEETVTETGGTALFPIVKNSSSTAAVISSQKFRYVENTARGGLKLQKHDTVTGTQLHGNAENLTAVYRLINLNEYDVVMKVNDQMVCTADAGNAFDYLIVTDENGLWKSDLSFLQTGKYRLEEITAPAGYVLRSDHDEYTTAIDFTVVENQYCDLTGVLGDEIMRGGFTVKKNDADGEEKQGDTDLTTKLRLVNRSHHAVVVQGKTILPGGVVDMDGSGNGWFMTDENGWYASDDQLLPYGTYELMEVEAPAGYRHSSLDRTVFTIGEDHQMIDLTEKIYDEVVTGRFAIYKHYRKHDFSQWDDRPEQGAVFLAVLTSKLDKIFDHDMMKAYEALRYASKDQLKELGLTSKEFSIVETDENGMGYSGDLAYGKYTIQQVEGDPETLLNEEMKGFEVKGQTTVRTDAYGVQETVYDDQKLLYYSATDVYRTYELKMVKKDADTGKTVTLNGASFMIGFDSNDNGIFDDEDRNFSKKYNAYHSVENGMVVQTVGNKKYHVFRTASEMNEKCEKGTFVVDEDNKTEEIYGTAYTPVHVEYGRYFIFETDGNDMTVSETPCGYVTASPVNVSAMQQKDVTPVAEVEENRTGYALLYDENSETSYTDEMDTIEVNILNYRTLGKLHVNKSIHQYEAHYSGAGHDFTGFTFELRAAMDILDPADGTVITRVGELAKTIVNGKYEETGRFHLDESGHYTLSDIPLGVYELKETDIPEEFVTHTETWKLEWKQDADDRMERVIEKTVDVENYPTLISVSKKAVTGEDELPGAQLHVSDENGEVIDSWISKETPHIMEGLKKGHTYCLTEDLAPLGYVKASSVYFTVNDEMDVQSVTMRDQIVEVLKQDCSFSSVKGAHMQIIDENGNIVDEWISDENSYQASNLETGKTYILREAMAPEGYVKSEDIVFVIEDNGKNSIEIMIDKQVTVKKTDSDGNLLENAKLTVTDMEGNTVDEWTRGDKGHAVNNLVEGNTYVLKETEVPDGYVQAGDQMFTVNRTKEDQELVMIDQKVEINKTDEEGNPVKGAKLSIKDTNGNTVDFWMSDETAHSVSGLKVNETYTIHEEESEELSGYYLSEDTTFTVKDDQKDMKIDFVDHSIIVKIEKVDEEGKYVSGAKLTLKDVTCDMTVPLENDGITSEKPFVLKRVLHAGHTYELTEEDVSAGYHPAKSVTFRVPLISSSSMTIQMVDLNASVTVRKTDENGKNVKGAEFSIFDEEGNTVYRFTTSDEPVDLSSQLKGGHIYTLHEENAPFGYESMEDMQFEVTGTKEKSQLILARDERKAYEVKLHKISDDGKSLAGAEFQIEDEEGNTVSDIYGNPCTGTTDETGSLKWETFYEPDEQYYVHETKAPSGYSTKKERMLIKLDETFTFESPYELTVKNSEIPVTAYSFNWGKYITAGAVAGAVAAIMILRKVHNG